MWKLKGFQADAFDPTMIVYNIWANTKNDLPSTMTDIGYGTALGFGSTAQTFDDSKEWRWNGTQWVEQTDGSGGGGASSADQVSYDNTDSGLTATNVQDAIDEIKDLDDMQDRALSELYAEDANQQLEINYAINTGVKNLLQYNGYGTGAENGLTYTINSDGTITVNGTPQGSSPSYIELKLNGNAANVARFCDGQHILSGCPAGGSDSTYRMYAARSTYSRFDYGNGVLLTDTTLTDVRLVVYIANGYTANNLVFSPMIRSADIRNSTYKPYAPTNRELWQKMNSINRTYKVPISSTPVNGIYFGVQMFPFEFDSVPNSIVEVQNIGQGGVAIDPTKFTTQINKWGFRIYTRESTYAGLIPDVKITDATQRGISTQSVNSLSKLDLDRNDLNESLDTNFDLIDSIPEEEEGEEDV